MMLWQSVIAALGCLLASFALAGSPESASSSFVPGPIVAVKMLGGVPTLFIEDKPQLVPAFSAYGPAQKDYTEMARSGVHVLEFDANPFGGDYYSTDVARGPDQWNYSELDSRLKITLDADPNAFIILRLAVGSAPQWWVDQHPEALEKAYDGSTAFTSLGIKLHGYPNLSAPEFRAAVSDGLDRLFEHLKDTPYTSHIAGFILTGTLSQEWYPPLPLFDAFPDRPPLLYSRPMLKAFQAWLKQVYIGDVKALSAAWKTPISSFEEVAVPPPVAFQEHLQQGESGSAAKTFRSESPAVEDFYRFYSAYIVDAIDYFAGQVKRSPFGNRFVGAIYGYMNEFAGAPSLGHNALARYLASPNLDGLLVEPSYYKRYGPTGAETERSPYQSILMSGKLLMADDDAGTVQSKALKEQTCAGYKKIGDAGDAHLAEVWRNNCQPAQLETNAHQVNVWDNYTVEENIWALTRFAGFSLVNGLYMTYFTQTPGAYDNPALLDGITKLDTAMGDAIRYPRSSVAEVLVVSDEDSNNYVFPRSRTEDVKDLLGSSLSAPRYALHQMGVPYDHILLDDLPRIDADRYKLVIFLNAFKLTSAQRANIQGKLMNRNRVLMFSYAAGLFDEFGTRQPGEFTQIKLDAASLRDKIQAPGIQLTPSPQPFARRLAAIGIKSVTPRFLPECCETFFAADPAATALGVYPGTATTSLAIRNLGNWTSLWSVTADLPAAFYREMARFAGVHIYDEQDDTLYVNRSFITIEATTAGQKTLSLPFVADVSDQVTAQSIAHGSSKISLTMKLGETRILRLEPKTRQ